MSKKEAPSQKIKLLRPMVYNGKVVPEKTILTVTENEARMYINSKKAVVAGPQTKDEK
jgi:hypothetical protein